MEQLRHKTAEEYRAEAKEQRRRSQESFERSDTDGFLSQWANDIGAQLSETKALLVERGCKSTFIGLYEGERRVLARKVQGKFGPVWLINEDDPVYKRSGRKFIPYAQENSKVMKSLGLSERYELDHAWAKITTGNKKSTGLSGCANAYVSIYRTNQAGEWGGTAELIRDEATVDQLEVTY